MSILSKIKDFLSKPLDSKYLLKPRSTEAIVLDLGDVEFIINGVSIKITQDRDVIVKNVRFLDIQKEVLFLYDTNKEGEVVNKLKGIYLKDKKEYKNRVEADRTKLYHHIKNVDRKGD
jgi:hypothetical protein